MAKAGAMICPECGRTKTRVIDSRVVGVSTTRRRRECRNRKCKARWTTYEITSEAFEWLNAQARIAIEAKRLRDTADVLEGI